MELILVISMFVSALALGALAILSRQLLQFVFFRKEPLEVDNIPFTWLSVGLVTALGWLLAGVSEPLRDTMRFIWASDATNKTMAILQYTGQLIGVTSLVWLIVLMTSYLILKGIAGSRSIKIEMRNGNTALAWLWGAILIGLALAVRTGMQTWLNMMVPMPDIPNIR